MVDFIKTVLDGAYTLLESLSLGSGSSLLSFLVNGDWNPFGITPVEIFTSPALWVTLLILGLSKTFIPVV